MDLSLQQVHRLSPQMMQSLNVLHMSAVDVAELVKQELFSNPFLIDNNDMHDGSAHHNSHSQHTSIDDHFLENIPSATSLQEHILQQVPDINDNLRIQLIDLIGQLDEFGFLPDATDEIYTSEAYQLLTTLDPAGIGAKNAQQCLLMQIKKNTQLYTLVHDYFDHLQHYRYTRIQRAMHISRAELMVQIKKLQQYNFHPGKIYTHDHTMNIYPEVWFRKIDGKWKYTVSKITPTFNDEFYSNCLHTHNRQDKSYFRYHARNAKNLIHSLTERYRTLDLVAQFIVEHQVPYLDRGTQYMRPITANICAQDMHISASTLSRAIANKYAHTPHGVKPLKYFFSTGIGGVAKYAIYARMQSIIDDEDKSHPYTDEQIAHILNDSGIFLSRRTVAKYRNAIHILPARTRKIQ